MDSADGSYSQEGISSNDHASHNDSQLPTPPSSLASPELHDRTQWTPYIENAGVVGVLGQAFFHCGYSVYVENRESAGHFQNEVAYDHTAPGQPLVDSNHPYAGCGGSPNEFSAGSHPIAHTFGQGGIFSQAGWEGLTTSIQHANDMRDAAERSYNENLELLGNEITTGISQLTNTIADRVENGIDKAANFAGARIQEAVDAAYPSNPASGDLGVVNNSQYDYQAGTYDWSDGAD